MHQGIQSAALRMIQSCAKLLFMRAQVTNLDETTTRSGTRRTIQGMTYLRFDTLQKAARKHWFSVPHNKANTTQQPVNSEIEIHLHRQKVTSTQSNIISSNNNCRNHGRINRMQAKAHFPPIVRPSQLHLHLHCRLCPYQGGRHCRYGVRADGSRHSTDQEARR